MTPDDIDRCRICDAVAGAPVLTVEGAYTSTWVACSGCGVQRIQPYPSSAELAAYYDNRYRDKDDFSDEVGFAVSHRVRYSPEYADRVREEYRQSLVDVDLTVGPTTSVLDFGCADGGFLDYLVAAGVPPQNLCGVDISREMVDVVVAKGLRALTLDDQDQLAGEAFDLISLWDVIEHVPDPVATLTSLSELLADGGALLMQTPRVGMLSAALGARFEHYLPLEHLHLFTREALLDAGARAGFTVRAQASFGANAPVERIPMPYKLAYDRLAKATDQGATQLVVLEAA